MSTNGKSFTFLSGFAGLVREVAAEDVDEGAAVIEGDRVLTDVEEFLNGYVVTLANDGGDVIFNGKVGIGTTSVTTGHIMETRGALLLSSTTGVGNSHFPFTDGRFYYTSDPETGGTGDHVFRTYSTGSYVEQMRILENGNVGIGTTSPGQNLEIEDATSATIRLNDSGGTKGTNNDARIQFEAGGVQSAEIGFLGTASGILSVANRDGPLYVQTDSADNILLRTSGTTRMTIDSSGRVGIGDTTPTSQLDVAATGRRPFHFKRPDDVDTGNVVCGIMQIGAASDASNPGTNDYWILLRRGDATTVGSIRGTGSASVNFSTTSDATLKTDNGPVAEARIGSIIDDLRIHDFDWIEGDVNNQIGVFAQEAIEVLPESIVAPSGEDDEGNYLPASLDYSKIVPILVAECQFLRGRVSALEAAASGNRPA